MKYLIKTLSYLALGLTILPVFFVLTGSIDDPTYKGLMLVGTIGWFITAPFWIFKSNDLKDEQ